MHFGLRYANQGRASEPSNAIELAVAAEEAGYESVWAAEHILVPGPASVRQEDEFMASIDRDEEDPSYVDPFVFLSYIASATTTVRLATGVVILPLRNPLLTAKSAASLDFMSGGRAILGVGVGWLRREFEILDVDYRRRGKLCDEYIQCLRRAWSADPSSYNGRFVSWDDIRSLPRPVAGRIPIVIGGRSLAAVERACSLGDGFFPSGRSALRLAVEARRQMEGRGRDPRALEITLASTSAARNYRKLSVANRIVVPIREHRGNDPLCVHRPEDVVVVRNRLADLVLS